MIRNIDIILHMHFIIYTYNYRPVLVNKKNFDMYTVHHKIQIFILHITHIIAYDDYRTRSMQLKTRFDPFRFDAS